MIAAKEFRRLCALGVALAAATVACSSARPAGDLSDRATSTSTSTQLPTPSDQPSETTESADEAEVSDGGERESVATTVDAVQVIDIDLGGETTEIDRRVFGVNVPAWIGPDRLADPTFIDETVASGATLVRMPGGSWSNSYRWSACEVSDESGCFWTWAARPSDFISYLEATGLPGMWTLSINESAQSAAAAVAFFNGEVGDTRAIGVDRAGLDWGTVDRWARLRVEGGHAAPVGIELWEVGNEVFGGQPSSGGAECASFGWEDVWTCDGREYIDGVDDHDGYLQIRAAMLDVDPTVQVGAVGIDLPGEWSNWGNEVIDGAGDALDFYVVHQYGFDASPSGSEAVVRPSEVWPGVIDALEPSLGDTPIAVTEYNLVSFEAGDTEQSMTKAMNAIYLAETLGQLVTHDVPIAAMWNLANSTTSSGTDYGLIDIDDGGRFPSFEAFRLWSMAGAMRHDPVASGDLRMYPTHDPDGPMTMIVTNGGEAQSVTYRFLGRSLGDSMRVTGVTASDLDAVALDEYDVGDVVETSDGTFEVDVPSYSILVLQVAAGA